jgi:hypothetical protein
MTYIDTSVHLDVFYNVVKDKTFKYNREGVPWRGRKEKAPVLM